ncbi:MAG TPA: GSCFA domain-containing protein [Bacteroidales bacterium]|nr:GSCFA domain-containing protein [Bacteroidales bacterium]HOK98408.1 GSCFA domain-containing protein [Bacteroidales bacterium]HPO65596.1 GSCFA domain-containing protein [Bacteroidales bacterium]
MKWYTPVDIIPSVHKVDHTVPVMMMGSCFAESIGEKLAGLKFEVDINPFGILFNPSSIKLCIERLIKGQKFVKEELIEHNYLWHSMLHHSRFSSMEAETTLLNINERLAFSSSFLRKARFLFITFGTAWIYIYKKTGQVVANCHKLPASVFERRLLSPEDIVADYRKLIGEIKKINPAVQIIFTVSPVRHLKDTAAGNNLSKSTLIVAVHRLCEEGLATYFPAYEIMLDELRDYRFYADDAVHPSEAAVDYIFEKFSTAYFDEHTKSINKALQEIQAGMSHKIEFPGHPSIRSFASGMLERIHKLERDYPALNFEKEKKYFEDLLHSIRQK